MTVHAYICVQTSTNSHILFRELNYNIEGNINASHDRVENYIGRQWWINDPHT
jgi:hypothetical protein